MIFLTILLIGQMNFNIDYAENYLGGDISQLQNNIYLIKEENTFLKKKISYRYDFEKNKISFLNKICRNFFIEINNKKIITSIFIATKEKICKEIFVKLVEKYGKPVQMLRMGAIKKVKENVREDYSATSSVIEAINCSFEENPVFIKWEKIDYDINIKMDYNRNTSLITFIAKE